MTLTKEDKKELLKIARQTIEYQLQDIDFGLEEPESKMLKSHYGAFVTLRNNGMLRGCIGNFQPNYELYKVVRDMAIQSAFMDNRFDKPTLEEMKQIDIEISVLSPFKKISNITDIELGKHGIYILKNGRSGTFLPQVATETGWSLLEFLGHCTQDKMGLGWYDWKDADIFVYDAEVFCEKEFKDEQ